MTFSKKITEDDFPNFLKEPRIKAKLRKEVGSKSFKDVASSIQSGVSINYNLEELIDIFSEILSCNGKVYLRFRAKGWDDEYHIDVIGLGGLYWITAIEHNNISFFRSLEAAEGHVYYNWNDNLVSTKPRRFNTKRIDKIPPFQSERSEENFKQAANTPNMTPMPKNLGPELKIDSVGALSKKAEGFYILHKSRLLMSESILSAEDLAVLVLESFHGKVPDKVIDLLKKHNWDDVRGSISFPPRLYLERQSLKEKERDANERVRANSFHNYLLVWIKNSKSLSWQKTEDKVYWAARDYIFGDSYEQVQKNEEVSVKRLHYAAQNIVENWNRFFNEGSLPL